MHLLKYDLLEFILNRTWFGIYCLPRRNSHDACCPYLGHSLLPYAVHTGSRFTGSILFPHLNESYGRPLCPLIIIEAMTAESVLHCIVFTHQVVTSSITLIYMNGKMIYIAWQKRQCKWRAGNGHYTLMSLAARYLHWQSHVLILVMWSVSGMFTVFADSCHSKSSSVGENNSNNMILSSVIPF